MAPLVREIVQMPQYRQAQPKLLTTDQLYTGLSDLTGWSPDVVELTDGLAALQWSPEHRIMGGGTDDDVVLFRSSGISLSHVVLMEWVGRQATLAIEDSLSSSGGVLFPDGLPGDEAAAKTVIVTWVSQFLSQSVSADDEIVVRLLALWQAAGGLEASEEAWGVVLQGLIRHPQGWVY